MDKPWIMIILQIKAAYNIRIKSEVTARGQWITLITDKGVDFSIYTSTLPMGHPS